MSRPDLSAVSAAERRAIEARLLARSRRVAPPSPPGPGRADGPTPLSPAQARLWFFQQLRPELPLYQSFAAYRLTGPLDVGALQAAVSDLVARHEILRTRFVVDDSGDPMQIIDDAAPVPVNVQDIAETPDADPDAIARSAALAAVLIPFDLERQWPFRAHLVRSGPEEHLFVLVLHHLVSDGWSLGVIYSDLESCYSARITGRPPVLPPLDLQYADYARWQQGQERAASWQRHRDWWRRALADIPPALNLPLDRPRDTQQSYRGGLVPFTLPAGAVTALRRLGRQAGATPYMAGLATFAALLHRLSGDPTVVIGTPVSGRTSPRLKALVGFFVNTLPLRFDFADEPDFSTLLGRTRETMLDAFERQDVPFDRIVEALKIRVNLTSNPIFQVMFQLNPADRAHLRLPGLRSTPVALVKATSQFDLSLTLSERDDGMSGWLEYSVDRFDPGSAERIVGQYTRLVECLVESPATPVGRLSPLTGVQRRTVLGAWRRGAVGRAVPRLVHTLVDDAAARAPRSVAIEHAGTAITYRQLVRRSTAYARHLRALGVARGSLVGLVCDPSPDTITAILGVLKAGAAYVPLDPRHPAGWLADALADAGVRVVLTSPGCAVPPGTWRTVELERLRLAAGDGSDEDWPAEEVAGDDLAYVIYTSGSTGRPKGVMVEHRSVANYLVHGLDEIGALPGDRCLQFASLSFDASVEDVFLPLVRGGTLILRDTAFDLAPATFVRRCRALRVNVLSLPTAYWHQLVALGVAADLAALDALRLVIIGGEQAAVDHVRRWRAEAGPQVRLVNSYGPTECTVVCAWADLTELSEDGIVPIGRPIPGVEVVVLDRNGAPVEPGTSGELYIGGVCLARGYLNRPDLTAERFVPDAFADRPGSRLYRTGDRARWLDDGRLVLIGRADHQVKVRGYRVEPSDVERELRRHSDVREAVVVARTDRVGEAQLVGYVVGEQVAAGDAELASRLRSFLRERLPAYMIPSTYMRLDTLPMTTSGKVDRRRLPVPPALPSDGTAEPTRPLDALEQRIAEIWHDVLGVRPVGPQDDFFDRGGHSLLAVKLASRVEQVFGRTLPVAALFPDATIERIAAYLRAERATVPSDGVVVTLRSGAADGSVVLVHPAGGDVVCYLPLARALPGSLSVHAVRHPLLAGLRSEGTDLEALAAGYLSNLSEIDLNQVRCVAGWSVGGVIALELARQLRDRTGRPIHLVAIDATLSHAYPPRDGDVQAALVAGFTRDVRAVLGLRREAPMPRTADEALDTLLAEMRAAPTPIEIDRAWLRARLDVFAAMVPASTRYRWRPYRGSATVLIAADRSDREQVAGHWRSTVTGEVDVHTVRGGHYGLLGGPGLEDVVAAWPRLAEGIA